MVRLSFIQFAFQILSLRNSYTYGFLNYFDSTLNRKTVFSFSGATFLKSVR